MSTAARDRQSRRHRESAGRRGWKNPLAVVALVLPVVLSACGDSAGEVSSAQPSGNADETDSIKIGVNRNVPWLAVWVAEERGLFEEHGIEAELVELGGGSELRSALLGGSVDFIVQSPEGSASLYQEGVHLVNLLATQGRLTWSIVLRDALEDEAAPGDAEALRGLTIGVTGRGGGSDMLLQAYLRENGLVPDEDVRIVGTGNYQGAVTAMEDGQLDGVMALEPATSKVLAAGYRFLFYGDGEVFPGADEAPMGSLATLDEYLDDNEDLAERVVQATIDALNVMVDETDWFVEFSAGITQVDPGEWGPVVQDQVIPYLTAEITERGWDALSNALLDGGVIEKPVPYEDVTATQFSDLWAEFDGG